MHGRDERCIAKHMVTMRPKISNKENAEIYEGKNEMEKGGIIKYIKQLKWNR